MRFRWRLGVIGQFANDASHVPCQFSLHKTIFYPETFIQGIYRNLTKHNIFAAFIILWESTWIFLRIKSYSFSKVYLEFYGHKLDKFCALCSKKFRTFFVSNCKLREKIVYVYWSSDFDNNLTWQALCNLFKEVWKDLKWFTGGYFGLKWELEGNPKFWVQ